MMYSSGKAESIPFPVIFPFRCSSSLFATSSCCCKTTTPSLLISICWKLAVVPGHEDFVDLLINPLNVDSFILRSCRGLYHLKDCFLGKFGGRSPPQGPKPQAKGPPVWLFSSLAKRWRTSQRNCSRRTGPYHIRALCRPIMETTPRRTASCDKLVGSVPGTSLAIERSW